MHFSRKIILALAAAAGLVLPNTALPQSYPAKPLRMVLTYSGGIDAVTRLIAQRISKSMMRPRHIAGSAT